MQEHAADYFETNQHASPYILIVGQIKDEYRSKDDADWTISMVEPLTTHSSSPAVTHVNGSARLHTVTADTNPLYHALNSAFYDLTGCPVVVNTSMNVRGEPIVQSPADAFRCLVNTEIDYLAIGPYLVEREEQDWLVTMQYAQDFAPD